jgi:hypothetical protein
MRKVHPCQRSILVMKFIRLQASMYVANHLLPHVLHQSPYRPIDAFCISLITCADTRQDTGNFYNFSNIRYAAPPVGNLRFAPPQAPTQNRSSVNKGQTSRYVELLVLIVNAFAMVPDSTLQKKV